MKKQWSDREKRIFRIFKHGDQFCIQNNVELMAQMQFEKRLTSSYWIY